MNTGRIAMNRSNNLKTSRSSLFLAVLLAVGMLAALPSAASAQSRGRRGGPGAYPGGGVPYGGGDGNRGVILEAKRQVKDAQAGVNEVRAAMAKIKTRLENEFKTKDDWAAAHKTLKKAQAAYNAALKPVQAALLKKPAYIAAKQKQTQARAKLVAMEQDSKTEPAALAAAAQEVANAGVEITRMQKEAVEADSNIAEAKERMAEAQKEVEALRDELDEALEADPEYQEALMAMDQAQQQLDMAKQSLAQAAAQEREAARSRREAAAAERNSRNSSGSGASSSRRRGGGF